MHKLFADMTLEERKLQLVSSLFIGPADEDYVAARWSYSSGMFYHFYWSSAQAAEKYLKALLLLNNLSSKKYGHNLVDLLGSIRRFDTKGLLANPISLPATTALGQEFWEGATFDQFVEHLNWYGSPDNRYASMGTNIGGPTIHVLDSFFHSVRVIIRTNNFFSCDLWDVTNTNAHFHDRIDKPELWMLGPEYLLERLFVEKYEVGQGKDLRHAFSNMNISFFSERRENESTFGGIHFTGSPVYNHLVRFLDPPPELAKHLNDEKKQSNQLAVTALRKWADDNIYFGKAVRKDLKFF